jgi:hypothetical protein
MHDQVQGRRQLNINPAQGIVGKRPVRVPATRRRSGSRHCKRLRYCVRVPSTRLRWEVASEAAPEPVTRDAGRSARPELALLKFSGIATSSTACSTRLNLSTRETLIMPCEREIARKDHRRVCRGRVSDTRWR